MVLDFPCMADYAEVLDPDAGGEGPRVLFLTHGHVFGPDHQPSHLPAGSALVSGHTHVKVNEPDEASGYWLFNPGSVGIPKDGSHSYGVYEDGAFRHVILEETP